MPPNPESRALANELATWRGHIDERGKENAVTLREMKADVAQIRTIQIEQGKELVALKTKVALGSGLGGLIGAGIVALASGRLGG